MANPHEPGYLSQAQIRIEMLNLATREACVRTYREKTTVEIAEALETFVNR